jgi:hypothetical protein
MVRRLIILVAALVVAALGVARASTTINDLIFDTLFNVTNAGVVMLGATTGHIEFPGSAPTPQSNCGSGVTIGGTDIAGRVHLGTSPGGYCALTFLNAWSQSPVCSVWNETSGSRGVFPQPSSTQLAIVAVSGSLTASDTLSYACTGYR